MKCPRDQSLLTEHSTDGISVFICPTCHGVLIHQDQFGGIRKKLKIEYPQTKRSQIQVLEEKAISPVNGELMQVIDHDGIKIDVCMTSNFIWLDYGEIEELFRKKGKEFKLGSKEPANVFDAIDAIHLADFLSELIECIWDGASNLIDF